MNCTLEDLWNGNIAPYDNLGVNDPKLERLAGLIERNRIELDSLLNKKQKEALEKYIGNVDEYTYLNLVQAFREGYCLATRLMAEALADE